MRIEPSPRQAAGNLHRKDENRFLVRSLTPPQAAGNALAITVQFVQVVALFVLIFSPAISPADEGESSSRWGITTKKNLENPTDTVLEETESAPDAGSHGSVTTSSTEQATPSPSLDADETKKIDPTQSQSPDKPASTKKNQTTAATRTEIPPQAIEWSSEGQKKACDGYLEDLRSLFLKTRHYSIQGASCDTAESAAAFLDSMETCQRNCPQGLLEYSGYSKRIIRNIRYLEKLGNDRCSGSLTPKPQVTQTP